MNVVCLDLEGVLVPEIWVTFAQERGMPELKRTTRDEPDYDKLMQYRLDILRSHNLGIDEISRTISRIAATTSSTVISEVSTLMLSRAIFRGAISRWVSW